ncbi:hypothetical protein FA13DRAFT_1761747 [Coprinellus micaceus]|uniref:Proteasome assembly chaperone 2 n=1 Tax=Coprinellus micaceus TaxID=71717 RepID=A0A4Y7TTA5_COPMI|nr:hypothetical protein FA13DRAFT_1761747 [Coprinellus micaceus]
MTFVYPMTPTNLAGKILVVPIVSTANVAQLAADLLIATLSLKRIAILDPSYCIPVVGRREDGLGGITTPLELFSSPESEVVIIQQRSPVLVSRKQEFADSLLSFIQTSQFSSVLFMSGMDVAGRTDAQMMTPTYQIRLPQFQLSLLGTSLHRLEELPIPLYRPQGSDTEDQSIPFIPGGGLTRRILNSIPQGWAIPTGSLLQFVLEGDNAADAAMLASAAVDTLELTIPNGQLKAPSSWKAGLFGSPHDQSLYG